MRNFRYIYTTKIEIQKYKYLNKYLLFLNIVDLKRIQTDT